MLQYDYISPFLEVSLHGIAKVLRDLIIGYLMITRLKFAEIVLKPVGIEGEYLPWDIFWCDSRIAIVSCYGPIYVRCKLLDDLPLVARKISQKIGYMEPGEPSEVETNMIATFTNILREKLSEELPEPQFC